MRSIRDPTVFSTLVSLVQSAILPAPGSIAPQSTAVLPTSSSPSSNSPLIIWHGLGDAYDSEGIRSVGELYQGLYPGSYIYTVRLGEDAGADRHASFFGNLTEQVNEVCDDIRANEELSRAPAANALGFSQGGVFLRGLIERCDAVHVRNLVTFGSPHSGISQFTECAAGDWWCKIWSGTLKSNTWGSLAQSTLVPAQYFRDSEDMENYLLYSNFLADVNNERQEKADSYKARIASLEKFVMYKFQEEDVLHVPESSWFADSNTTSGLLTRLTDRDLYKEDWLGLKKVDEAHGLIFRTTPGKHMQIQEGALADAFKRYFAPSSGIFGDWTATAYGARQKVLETEGTTAERAQYDDTAASREESGASASMSGFLRRYARELEQLFA